MTKTTTPRVDALMATWTSVEAVDPAFRQLRNLARELEQQLQDRPGQSNDRQATVKQGPFSDQVREALRDALSAALGDAMDCTRVWSAWGVGTMSEGDFQLLADNDERLDELVDAIEQALAPPAARPQLATEFDHSEGGHHD